MRSLLFVFEVTYHLRQDEQQVYFTRRLPMGATASDRRMFCDPRVKTTQSFRLLMLALFLGARKRATLECHTDERNTKLFARMK